MSLSNLSLAELVKFYNKHADKPIKGFKDKPTAIKRIKKLGVKLDFSAAAAKADKPKVTKKTTTKADKPKRDRRAEITFPLKARKLSGKVRKESTRGKMVAMLASGCTLEEMADMLHKHDKARGHNPYVSRAWRIMLSLNRKIGYGVAKTGDKYKLVKPS